MAYDPFNDPNRIARQAAQQAAETAQRMSRQARESAQRAADQAAATSRQFAEQNRQFAERSRQAAQQAELARQARQSRGAAPGLDSSQERHWDPTANTSPPERKRGGSKGFIVFLLVIGLVAVFGTMMLT